jgi:NAD(P)-dependent dehydrogenase (short-subunit alcohol dehydrogenase family)
VDAGGAGERHAHGGINSNWYGALTNLLRPKQTRRTLAEINVADPLGGGLVGERLDVLVHSAGQGHCLRIDELSEQEFRQMLDVAVVGAFSTAKAALPLLRASRGGMGHLIQICSLASGGTWNREVGYGTAKGAQLEFALHLASLLREEADAGGRVLHSQALCPGTVNTPFWDRIPQRSADPDTTLTADEVAWLVERWIEDPSATAENLASIKPRRDIVIKRHAPFERWDNVIAIAHESHP